MPGRRNLICNSVDQIKKKLPPVEEGSNSLFCAAAINTLACPLGVLVVSKRFAGRGQKQAK
jgi:hypothetical protein